MATTSTSPLTHRTTRFRYIRVTPEFVQDIGFVFDRGDSVVLLGPRGIGKELVMAQVQRQLRESGKSTVRFRCESFSGVSPDKFHGLVADELKKRISGFQPDSGTTADAWRFPLRRLLESESRHVVLLVSNVDSLPAFLARNLLKAIRELTMLDNSSPGRLSVFLTGAFDLAPLVYGADSELTVRDQYVIQGFGKSKFVEFLHDYSAASGLNTNKDGSEFLFAEVGGNVLLLRLVMETLMDERRAGKRPACETATVEELKTVIQGITERRSIFSDVILRPFSRLEASITSLIMLGQLLKNGECSIPPESYWEGSLPVTDAPAELELCGVACREGKHLVWASPLMKTMAEQYFTDWTLGDSFACGNDWRNAFQCFHSARINKLQIGFSPSHRPRVSSALRAFEAGLFRIASEEDSPVARLREFFLGGAHTLLGFDETTFWKFDDDKREWSLARLHGRRNPFSSKSGKAMASVFDLPSREIQQHILAMLPTPECLTEGINRVDIADAPFAMLTKLPEFEGRPVECLVLSSFRSDSPLTREWRGAAEAAVGVFCEAYQQARKNQQRARRATLQQNLLRAIPDVLRLLSGHPERTKAALQAAGDELRASRYRRVMFSMVDQQRRRIRGLVDCRKSGEMNVADKTDYALDCAYDEFGNALFDDIHQKCVVEGNTLVIADARLDPLANKNIVEAIDQRGLVLIPLEHGGRVLGTMQVEREDKKPPERDEIEALEMFASQLSRAIDATIWMDAIEEATHEREEAVFIVDPQERIRFANQAARQQYPVGLGWQDDPPDAKILFQRDIDVLDTIRQARTNESSLSRYVTPPTEGPSLRVVSVSPIRDWSDTISGYFVQLQDLGGLARLLAALQKFAACRDAETLGRNVLDELQALGYDWARLYRIDPETDRLVGHCQFGLPEDSEGAEKFQNRVAALSRRVDGGVSWLCIEQKSPVVLSTSRARKAHEQYTTPQGLTILNVKDAACPAYLIKKDGDRWVELPLFYREDEQPLGKISMECPLDLTFEQFKHLQILAEAASAGFAAIEAREAREAEEAKVRRGEMLRVIGETSHQLKSKLASLATLGERFLQGDPGSAELNAEWAKRLKDIQEMLDSVKLRLRPLRCERRQGCLLTFLREIFQEQLKPSQSRVFCLSADYPADFDPRLLKEAIEELILNARKAVDDGRPLQMSAGVSAFAPKGIPWCRIEIRDNGPGISQEKRDRVFDEFFSEWPQTGVRGTGLGLSFVKSIIAEHGGTIAAIESNAGACFRITFPRYMPAS